MPDASQRAAIARVFIDLIKADKVIETSEMTTYRDFKSQMKIYREHEINAYSMTMEKAMEQLGMLDDPERADVLGTFKAIVSSNGYCTRSEALLLLALEYCLEDCGCDADVISVPVEDRWFDDSQMIYVESTTDKEVNLAISTKLREIESELKLLGFDFIYIPDVVKHYQDTPPELMSEVVSMLDPTLSEEAVARLRMRLKLFKTDNFVNEQLIRKLGFTSLAGTDPALLFRIGTSRVDKKAFGNFLRIHIDSNVLSTVRSLCDGIRNLCSGDAFSVSLRRDEPGSFIYSGFYRQFFDILLMTPSVRCKLLVDFVNRELKFPEVGVTLRNLNRREKALYVLFASLIPEGGVRFTVPRGPAVLQKKHQQALEELQKRYAEIYHAFEGNTESTPDILSDTIRNPMLTHIRRSLNTCDGLVDNIADFMIKRTTHGYYCIPGNLDEIDCIEFSNLTPHPLAESELFRRIMP